MTEKPPSAADPDATASAADPDATASAVGGPQKSDLHLRAKVPLRMQAEAAERELGWRYKVYSKRVQARKMTEAEKAAGISEMRAIRDTLRLFAQFEDEIRATLKRCLERRAIEAEVADLKQADTVAGALIDAFPGAQLSFTESHQTEATP